MIESWWFEYPEMELCLDYELFGKDEYIKILNELLKTDIESPTKKSVIENIVKTVGYKTTDLTNSEQIIKRLAHKMTIEMISDGKLSHSTIHLLLTLPQNIVDKSTIRSKKRVEQFRSNFSKINETEFNHGNTSSD